MRNLNVNFKFYIVKGNKSLTLKYSELDFQGSCLKKNNNI